MSQPWCSRPGRQRTLRLAILLLGLCLPASPAWCHADLLLQIENLDRLLLAEPDNASLLAQRGDLYRRHEDYVAAARDFAAARTAQPDYPMLDFYEGQLLLETGDARQAEVLLDRYLLEYPQHAGAWILRAEIQLAMGEAENAANDYAMAVQYADQATPGLYRDWALALVAAGESRWLHASSVVDSGLEVFPRDISLLALGMDIALAEDRPDAAAAYIDRLPPTVTRLAAWQARSDRLDCLKAQAGGEAEWTCRAAAIAALREQASPPAVRPGD